MKLGILKEKNGETRVAATPDTVLDLLALGLDVQVESKAGLQSGFADEEYRQAGAKIISESASIFKTSDIVLKVQPPTLVEVASMKKSALLIGLGLVDAKLIKKAAGANVTLFSMEKIPRITRAQGMDVLSSQSNIAGYKAVLEALHHFSKVVPMMVTAAGTIKPAKVLVIGAGVAGLQAIATAKRMGAIVSVFDVRAAAKEQVESLGAKFIEVADSDQENETASGYAKEVSDDYKKKQSKLLADALPLNDILITTALIPGKPAPRLITDAMLKTMQPGSVVVDLAAGSGGNCAGIEVDKVITKHGLTLIGYSNLAAMVSTDSSRLYAKNLVNFIKPIINKQLKKVRINFEDEILQSTVLTHEGKVMHKDG